MYVTYMWYVQFFTSYGKKTHNLCQGSVPITDTLRILMLTLLAFGQSGERIKFLYTVDGCMFFNSSYDLFKACRRISETYGSQPDFVLYQHRIRTGKNLFDLRMDLILL